MLRRAGPPARIGFELDRRAEGGPCRAPPPAARTRAVRSPERNIRQTWLSCPAVGHRVSGTQHQVELRVGVPAGVADVPALPALPALHHDLRLAAPQMLLVQRRPDRGQAGDHDGSGHQAVSHGGRAQGGRLEGEAPETPHPASGTGPRRRSA
ncbi:hypothetical protein GCM10023334_037090 [Nonomuraea thailandensis]